MFIERLINQGNAPLLERTLEFASARHRLLAENIVNVDTPEFRQKDLSVEKFQQMLLKRVEDRQRAIPGSLGYSDIDVDVEHPSIGILSHDGNNRPMEYLMTEQAKNALMHNFVVELLRKQYQGMEAALKERVA